MSIHLSVLIAGLIPVAVGILNLLLHFHQPTLVSAREHVRSRYQSLTERALSLWNSATRGLRLLVLAGGGLFVTGALLVGTKTVDVETLGQSGDFLGGWLNPLVGLITVYLLVNTLQTQTSSLTLQEEAMRAADARNLEMLVLQRDTLRIQAQSAALQERAAAAADARTLQMLEIQAKAAFEQSLFTMNAAYRTNLTLVTATKESTNFQGPPALEHLLFEHFLDPAEKEITDKGLDIPGSLREARESPEAVEGVKSCLIRHWHDFLLRDTQIRSLLSQQMQLFRWIDRQTFLSEDDEYSYSAAIRAQLTRGEVVAWHFHLLTEDFRKELYLTNRYGLFALMSKQNHPVQKLARRVLMVEKRLEASAFRWSGQQTQPQPLTPPHT